MGTVRIPKSLAGYLESIIKSFPGIREVWLFGSRANGKSREDSDWDILAVADDPTIEQMNHSRSFHRHDFHVFVSGSRGQFVEPWKNRSTIFADSGSFEEWNWLRVGPTEAEYDHNKQEPGESFTEFMLKEPPRWKAYRIWLRDHEAD